MTDPDVIAEARALRYEAEQLQCGGSDIMGYVRFASRVGTFFRTSFDTLLAHCAAQEAQIATLRQALSDVRQGWTEAKAARLVEAEAQIAALQQELAAK